MGWKTKGWKPLDKEEKPPVAGGILRWRAGGADPTTGETVYFGADPLTRRWCKENLKHKRTPPYRRADIMAVAIGESFCHSFPMAFMDCNDAPATTVRAADVKPKPSGLACSRCGEPLSTERHPCHKCGGTPYRIANPTPPPVVHDGRKVDVNEAGAIGYACNRCNMTRHQGVHPCPDCGSPEYRVLR